MFEAHSSKDNVIAKLDFYFVFLITELSTTVPSFPWYKVDPKLFYHLVSFEDVHALITY